MKTPSIYSQVLDPSEDFDRIRSGLIGGQSYIDIQAQTGSIIVYYTDIDPAQGTPFYNPLNVSQNNGASVAADNTFPISGEWIYVDGVSDANMLVTLNDRDGASLTAADAPIRLQPGMFIRKRFTSLTVSGIATAFSRVRLLYGAGDTSIENPMSPVFGSPMPVYDAVKYRASTNIRYLQAANFGNAVGGLANQVISVYGTQSKPCYENGVATVVTPIANCIAEILMSNTAGGVPPTLAYPVGAFDQVNVGQVFVMSEFFAAQGQYSFRLPRMQFFGGPGDFCTIYARFRAVGASAATAQARVDIMASRAD